MDCEGKVNDFALTTDDALAFTIRHRLQSILRAEITASIIGGDTHKTTGTPRETVIDSNWILFRNPGPQVHGVPPAENKPKAGEGALNSFIKDRWPSLYVCTQVILD